MLQVRIAWILTMVIGAAAFFGTIEVARATIQQTTGYNDPGTGIVVVALILAVVSGRIVHKTLMPKLSA